MNCQKTRQAIINGEIDKESKEHINSCASCRNLYTKVNEVMALLDENTAAPSTLAASVMKRKNELTIPKVRRVNFASYIQIAAAIVFGIFIGHQFGKNANTESFRTSQDPIDKYIEAHHLTLENTDYKNPSIF